MTRRKVRHLGLVAAEGYLRACDGGAVRHGADLGVTVFRSYTARERASKVVWLALGRDCLTAEGLALTTCKRCRAWLARNATAAVNRDPIYQAALATSERTYFDPAAHHRVREREIRGMVRAAGIINHIRS